MGSRRRALLERRGRLGRGHDPLAVDRLRHEPGPASRGAAPPSQTARRASRRAAECAGARGKIPRFQDSKPLDPPELRWNLGILECSRSGAWVASGVGILTAGTFGVARRPWLCGPPGDTTRARPRDQQFRLPHWAVGGAAPEIPDAESACRSRGTQSRRAPARAGLWEPIGASMGVILRWRPPRRSLAPWFGRNRLLGDRKRG